MCFSKFKTGRENSKHDFLGMANAILICLRVGTECLRSLIYKEKLLAMEAEGYPRHPPRSKVRRFSSREFRPIT